MKEIELCEHGKGLWRCRVVSYARCKACNKPKCFDHLQVCRLCGNKFCSDCQPAHKEQEVLKTVAEYLRYIIGPQPETNHASELTAGRDPEPCEPLQQETCK